jgi:hypothetical protein
VFFVDFGMKSVRTKPAKSGEKGHFSVKPLQLERNTMISLSSRKGF